MKVRLNKNKKGNLPEGTEFSADESLQYALRYLTGRFPQGEPAIKKSPHLWGMYNTYLQTML
jgi:hypothetical protein